MTGRLGMTGGSSRFGKAYIPGVGYRSASKVPRKVLRRARAQDYGGVHAGRGPISGRGASPADNPMNQHLTDLNQTPATPSGRRNIWMDASMSADDREAIMNTLPAKGVKRPTMIHSQSFKDTGGASGWAMARAGTNRPAHVVLARGPEDVAITAHELGHATPRRNLHRLGNVVKDPHKLGREEARADVAGMRPTGRKTSGSGYEEAAAHGEDLELFGGGEVSGEAYAEMRRRLGKPVPDPKTADRVGQKAYEATLNGVYDAEANRSRTPTPVAPGTPTARTMLQRKPHGTPRPQGNSVGKSDRVSKVDTTMGADEAARVVAEYGSQGRLPSSLSRDDRMRAYEGRYVAAGGPKGEKWGRRARRAETASAAGQGVMGVGALGAMAAPGPRTRRAGMAGMLGGAAVSGLSGAAAHHARQKRSAYSSSPAGVAASALTRMRNYSPEG